MNNMIGTTSEQQLPTFLEHLTTYHVFSGVRVAQSLVFCVVFGRPLYACLSFIYFLLLYCLFFELRLLIVPLVSSNFFHCQSFFELFCSLQFLHIFLIIKCLYICYA